MLFDEAPSIELAFSGEIVYWRGPSPYHFVKVPPGAAREIAEVADLVTYGWGAIPATVRVGETMWATSLFPRDGGYLLPVRDSVRRAESVDLGDMVDVHLTMTVRREQP
jgi:hypothetical protein